MSKKKKNKQQKQNPAQTQNLIIFGIVVLLSIGALFLFASSGDKDSETSGTNTVNEVAFDVHSISPADFKKTFTDQDTVILDIRTKEEFDAGHIEGAVNIDFYQTSLFEEELNKLDKTKKYSIYCRTGNRTSQSLSIMEKLGFTTVTELNGGIVSWEGNGFDLTECENC